MSEDDAPDDAALQAEKDKRGGVKKGKNGSKACNWWVGNPTTGHYCGKTAGYSADKTTGLFRCIDHGGDREQLKRGRTGHGSCRMPGCNQVQRGGRDNRSGYCSKAHKQQHATMLAAQQSEGFRPPPDAAGV